MEQPIIMEHGFYNEHSSTQNAAMQTALPLLQQAVSDISLPRSGGVLQVLDQGCSQGSNSMAPVRSILNALYQRVKSTAEPASEQSHQLDIASAGPHHQQQQLLQQLSVMVTHEDLPSNDFASLLRLVADKDKGYLNYADHMPGLHVYSSVIGRSAYTRLVPDSYLHLTFSFAMMQWLSRQPALRPKGTFFGSSPPAEPEVQEAFRQQAHKDLKQLLMLRGAETRLGGALVALTPIHQPDGAWDQLIKGVLQPIFNQIIKERQLSEQEVGNMCVPLHMRSMPELQAALSEVRHVWTVKCFDVKHTEMPEWRRYSSGQITAAEYGTAVAGMMQAGWEPSLAAGLSRTRSPAAVTKLLQRLFDITALHFAAQPQRLGLTWAYLYLVVADGRPSCGRQPVNVAACEGRNPFIPSFGVDRFTAVADDMKVGLACEDGHI